MKKWVTKIMAVDPKTKILCVWMGPYVDGETMADAQKFCDENGLGYCEVDSEFIGEIGWDSALFATKILNDSIKN